MRGQNASGQQKMRRTFCKSDFLSGHPNLISSMAAQAFDPFLDIGYPEVPDAVHFPERRSQGR